MKYNKHREIARRFKQMERIALRRLMQQLEKNGDM